MYLVTAHAGLSITVGQYMLSRVLCVESVHSWWLALDPEILLFIINNKQDIINVIIFSFSSVVLT